MMVFNVVERSKLILVSYDVWGTSGLHIWHIIVFIIFYVTSRTEVLDLVAILPF